ncbi:MAG: hypothetical protein Tsb002_31120 [Wenzhouxiangellaceae bacterium]
MSHPQSGLLRSALLANTVFSTSSGVVMLLGADRIAPWLGAIPAWLITATGVMLLGFAAMILYVVKNTKPSLALGISALDLGWVIGTAPLVFIPGLLTQPGGMAVLIIAAIVGGLAVAQLAGIRKMLLDPVPGRGQYRHCVSVSVDAPAEKMWAVIADLGGISQFSPDLTHSMVRDNAPPGPGAVRTCSNTSKQTWSEAVEDFDPAARRLNVRFMSEEPDFPYPAKVMYGGWKVEEDGSGSRVQVWWSLTPTMPMGWLIVTLMGIKVDGDFAAVVSRMAEAANGRPVPQDPPKLSPVFC